MTEFDPQEAPKDAVDLHRMRVVVLHEDRTDCDANGFWHELGECRVAGETTGVKVQLGINLGIVPEENEHRSCRQCEAAFVIATDEKTDLCPACRGIW